MKIRLNLESLFRRGGQPATGSRPEDGVFGPWVRVQSSNIDAVRYRPSTRTLEVRFGNGSVYNYQSVPEDVVQRMLDAPSKGQYFHRYIRKNYIYSRVES